jgi:glycine cleavage system H protein
MRIEKDLRYSNDHEWVRIEGSRAYLGITDYAQHSLGEIVFVELPEIGAELAAGDTAGVVESVKAASDVYTPVSGRVVEVNESLVDDPGSINKDPYENWIAVLEMSDETESDNLMDASEYEAYCAGRE